MKFGAMMFPTDYGIDPVRLGKELEAREFDSLFFPEHTHIPTSRVTPPPTGEDVLDEMYKRTLDPFVALAYAAATTERLRIGTGILLPVQRDPIITAKEASTIDLISGGRFVFGVGAGWNVEEMRNHGTDPSTRGALLDERIEAIKALWTGEPAEYHGKFVDFDPVHLRPKPVQQPHPPIYIGGNSNALVRRVIRHDAGWLTNPLPVEQLTSRIAQLRDGAGRDVPVSMFAAPKDLDLWATFRGLGIERLGLFLPSKPRDETLKLLDEFAAKVADFDRG